MGKLFDYDGPYAKAVDKVLNYLLLCCLWTLFSLPLFTIGAANTALYYTVHKVLRKGDSYPVRVFWKAFKDNFKQSTVVWIAQLAVFVVLGVDMYFVYSLYQNQSVTAEVVLVCAIILAFIVMYTLYLYPYIARFVNTTKEVVKNCAIMSLIHFPWSLLLLVLFTAAVVGGLFVPLGVLLVPSGYMLLSGLIIERIFRKYIPAEEAEGEYDEKA